MQSSAWDPPRIGEHGDAREVAILYARQNLGRFYGIGSIAAIETHPPMYAWSMLAEVVYSLLGAERTANPSTPDAVSLRILFTQLNSYLRIMLVQMLAGELVTSKEPAAGMQWRPLVALAEERCKVDLKMNNAVRPGVREILDRMAASQDQLRSVFRSMNGSGPALHP